MPHLFREDLENIEEIILNDLGPQRYSIETTTHEYSKLAEIPEDSIAQNNCTISSWAPNLTILIGDNSATISTYDDDLKCLGVLEKIKSIILKRERRFLWFVVERCSLLFAAVVGLFFTRAEFSFGYHNYDRGAQDLFVAFIAILLTLFLGHLKFYRYSVIEFSRMSRHAQLSEQQKLAYFSSVAGACVGAGATLFIQWLVSVVQRLFQ
jgi:hypothetical protein